MSHMPRIAVCSYVHCPSLFPGFYIQNRFFDWILYPKTNLLPAFKANGH